MKHPEWSFINASSEERINGLKKGCLFCFDALFHMMYEDIFIRILENLYYYSTDYLFIHTWINNPFSRLTHIKRIPYYLLKMDFKGALKALEKGFFTRDHITEGKYQYFCPLEKYIDIFEENGFKLLDKRKNPDKIGGLYIFRMQDLFHN